VLDIQLVNLTASNCSVWSQVGDHNSRLQLSVAGLAFKYFGMDHLNFSQIEIA